MEPFFKTENLAVGYDGTALIHHICLRLEKGKILTLIGPNGGGKSTILKSITRHLQTISGRVFVGEKTLQQWQPKELAKQVKKYGEDAKVAIRNVRRDAVDFVKKAQKKGELTEDDQKKAEKDIQDLTDKYVKKVDEMCGKKDKELMEI